MSRKHVCPSKVLEKSMPQTTDSCSKNEMYTMDFPTAHRLRHKKTTAAQVTTLTQYCRSVSKCRCQATTSIHIFTASGRSLQMPRRRGGILAALNDSSPSLPQRLFRGHSSESRDQEEWGSAWFRHLGVGRGVPTSENCHLELIYLSKMRMVPTNYPIVSVRSISPYGYSRGMQGPEQVKQ